MADVSPPGSSGDMSLALHRVRFVDWSPSAITALAFSPVPPSSQNAAYVTCQTRSVLAVGRENGNIDLCTWCEDTSAGEASIAKGWMPELTLSGDVNYKIESLAFTLGHTRDGLPYLRLFSTSGGSILMEHFLPPSLALVEESGPLAKLPEPPRSTTRSLPSQGGAIWSMAASPTGKYLAIGCEDGVVRLIDVANDAFEHLAAVRGAGMAARMSRVASRILSLAWGAPVRRAKATPATSGSTSDSSSEEDEDEDEEEWVDTFLLGGLGNSTAVVWNLATGQLQSRLTLLKNRQEHTIVWSVAVLRDGTLVTGDSTGRVTFFDGRTRVPIPGATFQCHTAGADVLALCVSADSRTVYSAGVDQKVAEYSLAGHSWAHTGTRRLHAHDVRALAIDPPLDLCAPLPLPASTSSRIPILLSGGLDYHLVLTPALSASSRLTVKESNPVSSSLSTAFADTTQRRMAFVPSTARESVVAVAPARRWIVLRREQSVGIWTVEDSTSWRKVLELELKVRSNLVATAISADGNFLAVSDLYETKLYDMRGATPKRVAGLGMALHGRDEPAPGASALTFTPDSTRFVFCTQQGAFVHVIQLPVGHDTVSLLRSFAQHRTRHALGDGRAVAGPPRGTADVPATTPLASRTSRTAQASERDSFAPVVLTAVSPDGQWLFTADAARHMHVFHLDTLSHQRALASPACLPSGACFHPSQPGWLCLTLPTNRVLFYDLEADELPSWEQSLRHELDSQLVRIRDPVAGCVWLPSAAGAVLVLYGPTWLCTARPQIANVPSRKKRRNSDEDAEQSGGWLVRTTFKYQPLLYVGALSAPGASPELLAIERPYFALAQSLPPAFYRGAKYGM